MWQRRHPTHASFQTQLTFAFVRLCLGTFPLQLAALSSLPASLFFLSDRVCLARASTVRRQQMQTRPTLSPWTRVCPDRTAAPARETQSATSVPGYLFILTTDGSSALCRDGVLNRQPPPTCACVFYIDLRGLRRGLGGVRRRLQSAVPPGVSQLGVPTRRQVHLFGM